VLTALPFDFSESAHALVVVGLADAELQLVVDLVDVLRARDRAIELSAYAACCAAARRHERRQGLPPP
jgi:hypothetical protein